MSIGEKVKDRSEFSPSKQKIKQLVTDLATKVEGSNSKDVVAWGEIEIWPDRILRAEIIDSETADKPAEGIEDLYFGLEILDEHHNSLEEIGVDMGTNEAEYVFDETEPYSETPGGAPDYAIDSFIDRWNLHEPILSLLVSEPEAT
ncbi:MAG TPA: hypothetical protein VMR76_01630 [Candidatus Saccharimonadia bacterium]|nr:hypothetical protein [Candidatus Saccharimonadia bacterium]